MYGEEMRAARFASMEELPENVDWNWVRKLQESPDGSTTTVGLSVAGEVQGLMMLLAVPVPSAITMHKNAAYVEYLEIAPWNLAEYAGDSARYGNIGTAMLRYAVNYSQRLGCEGRLALHSLRSAEAFYRKKGFDEVGFSTEEGLVYFELSEARARSL